jgi:hypothetical protein
MVINMTVIVELPLDRIYECKAILRLDHNGRIAVTYLEEKTGDDVVMVYLGKEEIQTVVKLYLENHEFIENEGEVKKDENPTQPKLLTTNQITTP